MALPNKNDLKKLKPKTEKMKVPEWGDKDTYVYLEHPTMETTIKIIEMGDSEKPNYEQSVDVVILSVVDEDGNKFFSEEDRDFLLKQPSTVIHKISNRIMDLLKSRHKEVDNKSKNS